jgi:hypothetical protein
VRDFALGLGFLAAIAACRPQPVASDRQGAVRPPAPAYRPSPIPSGPEARTGTDDETLRKAWGQRNIVQAYDRAGMRSPRWDREARRYLEGGLHDILGLRAGPDRSERIARGRSLVAAGCRDPVVLYVLARVLAEASPLSTEPIALLKEAFETMKTAAYPRAVARYVASGLCWQYQLSLENRGYCRAVAPVELRWFRESLADSYVAGEDAVLAMQLSQGTGPSFVERGKAEIARATTDAGWTEPWVRRLVTGMSEVDLAFEARGTDAADKVTAKGWEGFHAHMALARENLSEAWRLRPDRPEAPTQMIGVLLSGASSPDDSVRLWLDRALAAQMDYLRAYRDTINYLRPRWYGSYEELLALGRECLETGRFDTVVPRVLLEAVEQIEYDQKDERHGEGAATIFREPDVYPLLVRMFEGYLAEPSQKPWTLSLRTDFAVAADKAGHPAEALAQLRASGFQVDSSIDKTEDSPARFVSRIAATGGPGGADVLESDRKLAAGALDEARALLRAAALKDKDRHAAPFFAHRLAALDLETGLAAGDWVELLPTGPDLPGWEVVEGDWDIVEDGGLRARPNTRGTWIHCNARVGPDFEMRGEIALGPGAETGFQAGPVFGDLRRARPTWFSFRLFRDASSADGSLLASKFSSAGVLAKFALKGDSNSFRLRSRRGRMSAWVNDRQVAFEWPPPPDLTLPPDTRIGLGGYRGANEFAVTYRRVAVRRLPLGSSD